MSEAAEGQVADLLGDVGHVARLDLVAVVLEATVPVLGHHAQVVAQDTQHTLDVRLADDAAQAGLAGVLRRDHDGHVVVENLNGQVLALLAEHLLDLLLLDLAGPVMGVHDVIADLVVDMRRLTRDLKVLAVLPGSCFADDFLLVNGTRQRQAMLIQVCR